MDEATFAAWVGGVALLDDGQRSQALMALALAEAGEVACLDTPLTGAASSGAVTAPAAAPPTAPNSAGSDNAAATSVLAQIGSARIASFGCPHCGGEGARPWGRANGKPRYRCTGCRRTFNPVSGTPLAGLHYPERWEAQAQALINHETIAKAADRCDIDYTTAFRWRHRFLSALNLDKPRQLVGIVEADETFILESFKGKRSDLPRPARERGGKASKRGLSVEQIPVIVARDRTGATTDAVLPRLDAASITGALGQVIARSAVLCCDGGSAIKAFARRSQLKFHVLPAPGVPKPEAPEHHLNNVNAYHGRLKEWLRPFHGVATKNLPNYLSWRRTVEALGADSTPAAWVMAAAGLGPYQQALR
jgi:transposase-like protein